MGSFGFLVRKRGLERKGWVGRAVGLGVEGL